MDLPGAPALFLAPKMLLLLQAFLGPEKHRAGLLLLSAALAAFWAWPSWPLWAESGLPGPLGFLLNARLPGASVFTNPLVLSRDCEGKQDPVSLGKGKVSGNPLGCPSAWMVMSSLSCNQGLREKHRPVLVGGSVSEWVAVLESV